MDDEQVWAGASRRQLLQGAGALAAGAALMGAPQALAGEPKYREKQRVDLHCHYLTQQYIAALNGAGIFAIGGIPIAALPVWSPESAMAFMDSEGIALQMLSVSDPGVAFLDDANAAALARDCNDHVAGVIRDRPDRFGAFAVLPLQDPAAARVEAVRALDELELDGVGLLSNAKGKYLGDPIYADLLGELNARGAWVMVHPTAVGADDKPSYSIPDFVAEYPFDTTRAIMSLLFNDMFRRYPKIRWHFAHGGGTIAMLRFRLTALAGNAAQFGALLGLPAPAQNLTAEVPKRVLKRSFFDTALIADQPSLAAVKEMGGVDGMLFGSDWPFAYRLYEDQPVPGDPQPTLSEFFDNDERRAIDRLNARSELKRLKNIIPGK